MLEKEEGGGATPNATQTSPARHAARKRRLEKLSRLPGRAGRLVVQKVAVSV